MCLHQYTVPKLLPCHHTFWCLECIQRLPIKVWWELNISTPVLVDNPFHYRTVKTTLAVQHVMLITYYLRKEGLSNYQVTSSMLELRQKLHTSKQEAAASTICLKHNDALKIYCETCHQVNTKHTTTSTWYQSATLNTINNYRKVSYK